MKVRQPKLSVLFLLLLGAVLFCVAGCGGEPRQVFKVMLSRTGPVVVEDSPTEFAEVSEFLKMQGAMSNSLIKVSFATDVPGSRKGALVTQLRNAGFKSVKCAVMVEGADE